MIIRGMGSNVVGGNLQIFLWVSEMSHGRSLPLPMTLVSEADPLVVAGALLLAILRQNEKGVVKTRIVRYGVCIVIPNMKVTFRFARNTAPGKWCWYV